MGLLVKGKWSDKWYNTKDTNGEYIREQSSIRDIIVPSEDATSESKYVAESGRYHLYVAHACPWAHRTLIFRALKGLESVVSVSYVSADMLENGWSFDTATGSSGDQINDAKFLHQIYTQHDPAYSGRVTVPVLWDKQTQQIVNNESSEIIRIFNTAFNTLTGSSVDYYPDALRNRIDETNSYVYDDINNGVYRAGFATTQSAYEKAYDRLFNALDEVEKTLSKQRYLVGETITEADWRLFTTLIRFDSVYFGHFKCNKKRIADFENMANYIRELYQVPGIKETTNFDLIKRHYYYSHDTINPTRIIPRGPTVDYMLPHNRDRFLGE